MTFPSTIKLFTFRYKELWHVSEIEDDHGKSDKITISSYNENQKFLDVFPVKYLNFEFNCRKNSAFIQKNEDLTIFYKFREPYNCLKLSNVKVAHFSTNSNNQLFILSNDNVLRIFDIRQKNYQNWFQIENVTNFAFFSNLFEQHYLAIIQDHELHYYDSVTLDKISHVVKIDDNEKKLEYDIITKGPNVYVGSRDDTIVYINDEYQLETIFQKNGFSGFIEINNDIFCYTSDGVYILQNNLSALFSDKDVICASLSPHILAYPNRTEYIEFKLVVNKENEVSPIVRQTSLDKEKEMSDNSLFERINMLQIKGERLQKRQKRLDENIQFLGLSDIDKYNRLMALKGKYENLIKELSEEIRPYDINDVDKLKRKIEMIKTEFNNQQLKSGSSGFLENT